MCGEIVSAEQRIARWRQRIWNTIQTARTDRAFLAAGMAHGQHDGDQLAALGWRALHAEQPHRAEHYFRAAIHYDPYTVSAWFGLGRVTPAPTEKRTYLQAALDLQQLVSEIELVR